MALTPHSYTETVRYNVGPALIRHRFSRSGYKQSGVIDPWLPTQYTLNQYTVLRQEQHRPEYAYHNWDISTMIGYEDVNNFMNGVSWKAKTAHAKAYNKLLEDLKHPNAAIGVSLAEGREALKMMTDRIRSLRNAFSDLRRGRFWKFLKWVNLRPHPKHRQTRWTRPKDAAALWLEYWLGWAPMVGDVYNAIDVLTKTEFWPSRRIVGSARVKLDTLIPTSITKGHLYGGKSSGYGIVKIGAEVQISNPNAYLMNQLGLVNPISVAWALVPFSFVVEWFVKLGATLDAMTDFVGLKVTRTYTTRFVRMASEGKRIYNIGTSTARGSSYVGKMAGMTRRLNIDKPAVIASIPAGLSISRGATAVSLLVSIFTKG